VTCHELKPNPAPARTYAKAATSPSASTTAPQVSTCLRTLDPDDPYLDNYIDSLTFKALHEGMEQYAVENNEQDKEQDKEQVGKNDQLRGMINDIWELEGYIRL
jgi:hypothetical protein